MSQWNNEKFEELLNAMQRGEDSAFDTFFRTYYDRLVRLAKKKIGSFPLRTFDEEDLAISAMRSLFAGICENRYEVQSGVDLWKILVSITNCKWINMREKMGAKKRGSGNVRGDSIWVRTSEHNLFHEQKDIREELPDICAELLETTDMLFQQLKDEEQRKIARLLLEGYRIDDIATELDCVRRTIERKIAQIRKVWGEFLEEKN